MSKFEKYLEMALKAKDVGNKGSGKKQKLEAKLKALSKSLESKIDAKLSTSPATKKNFNFTVNMKNLVDSLHFSFDDYDIDKQSKEVESIFNELNKKYLKAGWDTAEIKLNHPGLRDDSTVKVSLKKS